MGIFQSKPHNNPAAPAPATVQPHQDPNANHIKHFEAKSGSVTDVDPQNGQTLTVDSITTQPGSVMNFGLMNLHNMQLNNLMQAPLGEFPRVNNNPLNQVLMPAQ
eukprot:CAMPEP_0170489098 /NCGR_PEP_ID=MMETSP0208-20121228/7492_1 /TAXON_ID=197538 /ORGANISM="Strombidium inclinatum, Strain S3" /LENGTH=104 /DNA_ID=CAMNT_0010763875 /DNA_START=26 /DNA_END=340 /DNA_ORIENTATION=+